ncbi:bublin coiled-coil protein isoform X3 [Lethenteron reissneri]|uniref:bublin coiled-coil protein isoform X3 n=1 Tax=Lethenteron reissneri TaxID=7753 RepID=UPI002AB5FB4C|nr:bublin coiled-coil protein isoform X3 [Lethenteron reissneri]
MAGPNGEPSSIASEEDASEDALLEGDEEYQDLNSALDQISSFLDQLEERNDSLNTRLRELLASNQQERRGASSEAQGTQQQNER